MICKVVIDHLLGDKTPPDKITDFVDVTPEGVKFQKEHRKPKPQMARLRLFDVNRYLIKSFKSYLTAGVLTIQVIPHPQENELIFLCHITENSAPNRILDQGAFLLTDRGYVDLYDQLFSFDQMGVPTTKSKQLSHFGLELQLPDVQISTFCVPHLRSHEDLLTVTPESALSIGHYKAWLVDAIRSRKIEFASTAKAESPELEFIYLPKVSVYQQGPDNTTRPN